MFYTEVFFWGTLFFKINWRVLLWIILCWIVLYWSVLYCMKCTTLNYTLLNCTIMITLTIKLALSNTITLMYLFLDALSLFKADDFYIYLRAIYSYLRLQLLCEPFKYTSYSYLPINFFFSKALSRDIYFWNDNQVLLRMIKVFFYQDFN